MARLSRAITAIVHPITAEVRADSRMGRVLYIVARERSLLCGYLMARVGPGSLDGHRVEIKIDERRGERRRRGEAQDPERRRGERRHQPNHASDLRTRGYATAIESESLPSPNGPPARRPAMVWPPRSGGWDRATQSRRRRRVRWWQWGLLIASLLTGIGGAPVVGRSIYHAGTLPGRAVSSSPSEPVRQPADGRPLPPAANPESGSPAGRPEPPPSSPAPVRVVTTRASGIVLAVNPSARTLVLQDMGAAPAASQLRVALAPDARIVLSERDDRAEDLSHPFKDTVSSLSDVRKGDFVVVDMRGPEGTALARSVVVTLRGPEAAGGPAPPAR